jgi:hypothetical protein
LNIHTRESEIEDKVEELDQTKIRKKYKEYMNGTCKTFGTPSKGQSYESWV